MKEKKEVKEEMIKIIRYSIEYHTKELAKFTIQLELLTDQLIEDEDTHS